MGANQKAQAAACPRQVVPIVRDQFEVARRVEVRIVAWSLDRESPTPDPTQSAKNYG
jgi:hypothetical protein